MSTHHSLVLQPMKFTLETMAERFMSETSSTSVTLGVSSLDSLVPCHYDSP